MVIHLGLLLWLSVAGCDAYENFEGYTVLQVIPNTEEQLKDVASLAQDNMFETMFQVDFWLEPSTVGRPVHIMVPGEGERFVRNALESIGLDVTVHISDVSELILAERERLSQRPETMDFDYDDYNDFAGILEELDELKEQCPGDVTCEVFDIGTTVEGRPLKVFKMSKPGADRPAYWLDATIHAREWIATATIMRILRTMVTGDDDVVEDFLDRYDWYFLPVVNPDGYSYTWTDSRMWRKNRGQNSGSTCFGTDLNRNYNHLWGGAGSSANPCSDTYRGDGAASEEETKAVQEYMGTIASSLKSWINIHSYSQFWLIPWGDSQGGCVYADDHADMMMVAHAAANASEAAVGDTWKRGNWCEVLYASTGILQDYAKAQGIKYTFTPELRGNTFSPPPSEIEPSYQEVWGGVKAIVNTIP